MAFAGALLSVYDSEECSGESIFPRKRTTAGALPHRAPGHQAIDPVPDATAAASRARPSQAGSPAKRERIFNLTSFAAPDAQPGVARCAMVNASASEARGPKRLLFGRLSHRQESINHAVRDAGANGVSILGSHVEYAMCRHRDLALAWEPVGKVRPCRRCRPRVDHRRFVRREALHPPLGRVVARCYDPNGGHADLRVAATRMT